MVGETGFEPATPWSQTRCATSLRHSPTICSHTLCWLECEPSLTADFDAVYDQFLNIQYFFAANKKMVDPEGLEPPT